MERRNCTLRRRKIIRKSLSSIGCCIATEFTVFSRGKLVNNATYSLPLTSLFRTVCQSDEHRIAIGTIGLIKALLSAVTIGGFKIPALGQGPGKDGSTKKDLRFEPALSARRDSFSKSLPRKVNNKSGDNSCVSRKGKRIGLDKIASGAGCNIALQKPIELCGSSTLYAA